MGIVLLSAFVSFVISFAMMKWHIHNIKELYKKYLDLEISNIEKFSKDVIDRLK